MDLPKEIEDYIKETIEETLGLPVSAQTLQIKLRSAEETNRRLGEQHQVLLQRLNHKDQLIDRVKAEASMNAVALKKFVEENQRLAAECAGLVAQCEKWERECSLYDHDREALMDFGNEADERAKEAEGRVRDLEEQLSKVSEELHFYKNECETRRVDSCAETSDVEENMLDSFLGTLVSKDDVESACGLLEVNNHNREGCRQLLNMWDSLRPATRKALSLAAAVKILQHDKEHLRINLSRAEEEATLLFKENNLLDEENKRLSRQVHKDRQVGSSEKHSCSTSAKSNKRKSSSKISSPGVTKMMTEFHDIESLRQPLSPLRQNYPNKK